MDKQDLKKILAEIEKEDKIFSKKSYLDNLSFPKNLIGREKKAKELVRFLAGYQKGLVVPFVSVYGRSGSGKSTVVRFVCENLDGVEFGFVNLRNAKTIFGSANLILAELGQPNLKGASGLHSAIQQIGSAIKQRLDDSKKQLYVLVLDEFDTIFYDKRSKPSDFVYKLITMEEDLRQQGYQICIIAISNNVVSEYDLDDRVKSRIGTSEVFFEPYSKDEVLKILKDRARHAFSENIDNQILEYCAGLSSEEHGDARRAIDLLRVGAEIAGKSGENLSKNHIDMAYEKLQNERAVQVLSNASYQLKVVCTALARITFLSGTSIDYAGEGEVLFFLPDGSRFNKNEDCTSILIMPDGTTTSYPPDVTVSYNPATGAITVNNGIPTTIDQTLLTLKAALICNTSACGDTNRDVPIKNYLVGKLFSVNTFADEQTRTSNPSSTRWDPTQFDVIVISESVDSAKTAWLKNEPVGIVTLEGANWDEFRLGTSGNSDDTGAQTVTSIKIINNQHFITQPYQLGPLTIATTTGNAGDMSGWNGPASQVKGLAEYNDSSGKTRILAVEKGDKLVKQGSGQNEISQDRRVFFGARYYDNLNSDGQILFDRSVVWASGLN